MASAPASGPSGGTDEQQPRELLEFLLYLGSALTAAGEAVNRIEASLRRVAGAYGAPRLRVSVLPTYLVIALEPGRPATLEPTRALRGALRLDQTAALFDVLESAERGEMRPADGIRRILAIVDMRPRFRPVVTVLGHLVLTVGICALLEPTWGDLVLAALFGVLVGLFKLVGARWTIPAFDGIGALPDGTLVGFRNPRCHMARSPRRPWSPRAPTCRSRRYRSGIATVLGTAITGMSIKTAAGFVPGETVLVQGATGVAGRTRGGGGPAALCRTDHRDRPRGRPTA